MTASLWIIPFKVSELLPPELAVIVWSSAVIWPDVTLGAPPRPNAFPSATTVSPTSSDDESANLTVGRPDTLPSIWITAMSCEMSTPTTWAEYFCERPCTVTVMLVEPLTTWLLVRISPVELTIMPVPAAGPCLGRRRRRRRLLWRGQRELPRVDWSFVCHFLDLPPRSRVAAQAGRGLDGSLAFAGNPVNGPAMVNRPAPTRATLPEMA